MIIENELLEMHNKIKLFIKSKDISINTVINYGKIKLTIEEILENEYGMAKEEIEQKQNLF